MRIQVMIHQRILIFCEKICLPSLEELNRVTPAQGYNFLLTVVLKDQVQILTNSNFTVMFAHCASFMIHGMFFGKMRFFLMIRPKSLELRGLLL